jgi:heme-degrading monooxygenase HmoA
MSRLRVDAGPSDALVAAFRRRAHLVDAAPGFVDLQRVAAPGAAVADRLRAAAAGLP